MMLLCTVLAVAMAIATFIENYFGQEGARVLVYNTVLVQNQKGRTKPLYTVSSDILHKVAR